MSAVETVIAPQAGVRASTGPETHAVAGLGADRSLVRRALRRVGGWLYAAVRYPGTLLAGAFVALIGLAAIHPAALTRQDPYATAPTQMLLPPSAEHWFGTDQLGRDLYSRVVYGAQSTVLASLISLSIAIAVGVLFGVIAGYVGGATDATLMRFVDVLLSIPGLLLSITIVTAIGFGTIPVAIAIGVASIPTFARTARAQTLRVCSSSYIEAAIVSGVTPARIIARHVLRNVFGPVFSLALLEFGRVIMAVATLSFLGFGAKPPVAEWGSLINEGRSYLMTSSWVPLLPGLVVVLTVLAITVLAARSEKELKR